RATARRAQQECSPLLHRVHQPTRAVPAGHAPSPAAGRRGRVRARAAVLTAPSPPAPSPAHSLPVPGLSRPWLDGKPRGWCCRTLSCPLDNDVEHILDHARPRLTPDAMRINTML